MTDVLEIMAKAYISAGIGPAYWDDQSDQNKLAIAHCMRAALLALAEAELPDRLHGTQDNGEEYVIHANVQSTRWLFRSICRSLAEGELCVRLAEKSAAATSSSPSAPLHSGPEWRPIETAPKDKNIILSTNYEPFRVNEGWWNAPDHGEYLGDCGGVCRCPEYDPAPEPMWMSTDGGFTKDHPPTHWMPLPSPPRTECQIEEERSDDEVRASAGGSE